MNELMVSLGYDKDSVYEKYYYTHYKPLSLADLNGLFKAVYGNNIQNLIPKHTTILSNLVDS